MAEKIDLKKLKWTCRRGMLELDVILVPFVEKHFASLDEQDQRLMLELLEQPDPDLFNWIMGYSRPEDDSFAQLVSKIRSLMGIG
ncbi:succinate dehydrogenase assembly factor 2 [Pleionea sediminis]|uniref:FAD assembly factor SdhE n=1 Tax=Pleionea sediminis TaxID=2569479 RepID=UPI0011872EB5|nr:succinate dehydrogenase assembly factor 2 [Pleionea sediminis]